MTKNIWILLPQNDDIPYINKTLHTHELTLSVAEEASKTKYL